MKSLKINTGAARNEVDRTDHVKNFIHTLYGGKPMTKEKENELFREYILTKNPMIKDTIVKCNTRFVYSAAKAFTNDPEEVLDLTMEGTMGLLEAFDRFDPDTGLRKGEDYMPIFSKIFIPKNFTSREGEDFYYSE